MSQTLDSTQSNLASYYQEIQHFHQETVKKTHNSNSHGLTHLAWMVDPKSCHGSAVAQYLHFLKA